MKTSTVKTSRLTTEADPDYDPNVEHQTRLTATDQSYLPHGFNPQVAELYGVNAALIFRYLSYCTDNGRWASPTLAELCERYPYLGEWQIWAALKKLTNAGKKTPPLVLRKLVNGAYVYRPAAPDTCISPHTFDVRIAMKVGVIPAIMFHNLCYFIKKNWKLRAEALFTRLDPDEFDLDDYQMQRFAYQMTRGAATHYTTAVEWLKQHPYAKLSSAKCCFIDLQKAGLIRKGLRKRHRQFWHLTRKTLNCFEQEMLSKSILGNPSSETKPQRQKPKTEARNPKSTPETQNKQGLSDSPGGDSNAFEETVVEEVLLRLRNQVADDSDAFRASSLADASANAGTASNTASPRSASPSVSGLPYLSWSVPNLPSVKKKLKRDAFGHVRKTTRRKQPLPDDPEFYEYIDGLTVKERLAYMDSNRKSSGSKLPRVSGESTQQ